SVLPSIASLRALRQFAKASPASKRYVSFGNPLLLGRDGTNTSAWDSQRCPTGPQTSARRVAARGQLPGISTLFRGNLADVAEVQKLDPLPDTTRELCEIARMLGVPENDIWLGERATERNIKDISQQGKLADYSIV